jgi:hypothetical protein
MLKVASIGVGVQTSAMYIMSSLGEMERYDYAIFADTGGEKQATIAYYKWLSEWKGLNNGIPLYDATYKNIVTDLLNGTNSTNNRFASIPAFTMNNGEKGMLRRQCTNEYKIAQVDKKIREILELKPRQRFPQIEIVQGITVDEATRMKVPQQKWKVNVYPFCGYKVYSDGKCERIDTKIMSRNDIFNWFKEKNLSVPEKSSCVFCPFQSDTNWIRLKQREPESFALACKIDHAIRDSSKKGIKSKIYLHESLRPLDEVVFDESQMQVWGNCSDYCDI